MIDRYNVTDFIEAHHTKIIVVLLAVVFALAAVVMIHPAYAGPLDETRYCGPPARNASGEIIRRADVLRAFERAHSCPQPVGNTCPGWYRDHVIPLACGGCDSVSNLQWLRESEWRAKSLYERKIYKLGGGAC